VGSIAVALDKQADREALEREVVRMRAVVAANDALRDTFSQDDVFRQTVSSAERHMGARAVWLFYVSSSMPLELDPDNLEQYVVAKAGQHDILQPDGFLCQSAYKLGVHALASKHVCSEHLSDTALFAVPLMTEQQHVPGVLVVATNTISQSESAFAEALAQAASSALVRLGLVTARAQEAAAYRALANFGATIEAINDVDTLMQLGIKQLMVQLELEAAFAYDVRYQQDTSLRDPVVNRLVDNMMLNGKTNGATANGAAHADDVVDADDVTDDDVTVPSFAKSLGLLSTLPTLYPAGVWGQHPPGFSRHFKQPFNPTAGVMLEVLQGKKARYIEDYQRYARAVQPYLALGMRTLLVIPVLQRAHIVKIILLSSYKQVQPLSEEQLAIARSFVRRLENAIERVDNVREVESTREATLRALGLALEYRDFETKGHSERVVALSLALADKLSFDAYERQALRWGAYLHDIGKVGVPDSILLKPSKLSDEEFATVKKHTVLGYSLCRDIPFLPAEATAVVRSHHERWDGSGYPDGLAGERIPLMARLFSLVDVYDALTNPRVYKHAWEVSRALQEIRHLSGKQFDPELTHVFLEMISQRKR
jgi:putative nucleotidyltransferase with HDIG domain